MTLYLVRHAHAGSRHRWDDDDSARPLSKKGLRQAQALADWLEGRPVTRLLSSPAVRCTQSLGPLGRRRDLEVEVEPALGEGRPPAESAGVVRKVVAEEVDALLCSHGDVIPELLDALAADGCEVISQGVLAKGGLFEVETRDGRPIRATYLGPDDLTAD